MKSYDLAFDLHPLDHLDDFGLLATQVYNLSNRGNWFYWFRRGVRGLQARIYGVGLHYYEVHAWHPRRRSRVETDYHLASIFFGMDSALECVTFAMNALGNAVDPAQFKDITDEKALRGIAPHNIVGGSDPANKRQQPLPGYGLYFPEVQKYWQTNRALVDLVMEHHDISKHRTAMSADGRINRDAPPGFFEALGIGEDLGTRFQFSPLEEILLEPEPKKPLDNRAEVKYEDVKRLEDLAEEFCEFINKSCRLWLSDATAHIKLPHTTFLKQVGVVYHAGLDLYEDAECTKKREGVEGVMLGTEYVGWGTVKGGVSPTTRLKYYRKGKQLASGSDSHNLKNVFGETWYLDPDDGQKKFGWQSSAEFIAEQLD
jgi:hypothetical protein